MLLKFYFVEKRWIPDVSRKNSELGNAKYTCGKRERWRGLQVGRSKAIGGRQLQHA